MITQPEQASGTAQTFPFRHRWRTPDFFVLVEHILVLSEHITTVTAPRVLLSRYAHRPVVRRPVNSSSRDAPLMSVLTAHDSGIGVALGVAVGWAGAAAAWPPAPRPTRPKDNIAPTKGDVDRYERPPTDVRARRQSRAAGV